MSDKPDYVPLEARIMTAIRKLNADGAPANEIAVYVGDDWTAAAFLPEPSFGYDFVAWTTQLKQARESGTPFGTVYGTFPIYFDTALGMGIIEVRSGERYRATLSIV